MHSYFILDIDAAFSCIYPLHIFLFFFFELELGTFVPLPPRNCSGYELQVTLKPRERPHISLYMQSCGIAIEIMIVYGNV